MIKQFENFCRLNYLYYAASNLVKVPRPPLGHVHTMEVGHSAPSFYAGRVKKS